MKKTTKIICNIYLFTLPQKQPITKLHDICLVNSRHPLTSMLDSIVKCKFGNATTLGPCHDLEAFNNACHTLVFKGRIFAFSLFSDNHHVHVLVADIEAGQGLDVNHISIQVKVVSERMSKCQLPLKG